jgi:hypothetical protein
MKTIIITSLSILTLHAVGWCADPVLPTPAGKNASVTNQIVKLKGFMGRTRVLDRPVPELGETLKAAKPKMKEMRKPDTTRKGPQDIQAAADYLAKSVSMACPPGACVEYDGVFFFSGGRSTQLETNFLSGFAIKKGDTAIHTWEAEIKKKDKQE